ncbi:MAG: hypothetical protein AAFV80_17280 [Bacteroidota bacterium]
MIYIVLFFVLGRVSYGIGTYDLNRSINWASDFTPMWPFHPLLPHFAAFWFALLLLGSTFLKRKLNIALLAVHLGLLFFWWLIVLFVDASGIVRFLIPGLFCWAFFCWVLLRGDRFGQHPSSYESILEK